MKFGYHALLEKTQPEYLLKATVHAEESGFDSVWVSDHFHPWAPSDGCAFAWCWLTAAAERTKRITLGTSVTTPTLRYNPAIVAQAFATLGYLYPGRIFLGLGTGEAMNEVPAGACWPSPKERIERLREAIDLIKNLWTASYVDFKGKYYSLKKANLFTRPVHPIPIYVAANGPRVAELAGECADGFITPGFNRQAVENTLFPALKRGADKAGRNFKTIVKVAELHVSYDEDFEKAVDSSRFLAASLLPTDIFKSTLYDPREIEDNANQVDMDTLIRRMIISNDPEEHIRQLVPFVKQGFDVLEFVSLSPNEEAFIETYSKNVLPHIAQAIL
jgi:coenzyme F420-dependent glucose-6-phosphate dehydrogenase